MDNDPFLWLEDIDSPRATTWVDEQNAKTLKILHDADSDGDVEKLIKMFNAPDRIPGIRLYGDFAYNFWTDEKNPRGLWRRTTLESYRTNNPEWEILLDIDALGAAEAESWVWGGAARLKGYNHVLISLSRGGADATVVREFDLLTKSFVVDGFKLDEAKTDIGWLDQNTVLVGTALEGAVTESGYARQIKRWHRGQSLAEAEIIFSAETSDVYASVGVSHEPGREFIFFGRAITFQNSEKFYEPFGGTRIKLDIPLDADAQIDYGRLTIRLRTPWLGFEAGTLLLIDLETFLNGGREFTVLFTPLPRASLEYWLSQKHQIILVILENVRTVLYAAREDDTWRVKPLPNLPSNASLSVSPLSGDDYDSTTLLLGEQGFLAPFTYCLFEAGHAPEELKKSPAKFDATGMNVAQYEAKADDGTLIPYFFVSPKGEMPKGGWPTQLNGYGGFEVSLAPYYIETIGALWLSRGGAFAMANIRGGGEFGPGWHEAGKRKHKKISHDDFAAVARDIAARGLSSPAKLLGAGGSNGGLLVGNMLTRHPESFGAIICTVPLLDMQRYTKLFAGASWIDEYGDPENPEEWAFIKDFSPYHLAKPGQPYPPILIMTTKRDDRVHPSHARKMAALLQSMGYGALYFEQIEGGHGAGADSKQRAIFVALEYAFHRRMLKN